MGRLIVQNKPTDTAEAERPSLICTECKVIEKINEDAQNNLQKEGVNKSV